VFIVIASVSLILFFFLTHTITAVDRDILGVGGIETLCPFE
jgi:hypothetical protein